MSISRSVAEVLREHVTLEIEGIDRMYLNVYVPQLQRESGVASFFRFHRGHRFASSVLMDPISKAFVEEMERWAKQDKIPMVLFKKGERKDDIAAEYRFTFAVSKLATEARCRNSKSIWIIWLHRLFLAQRLTRWRQPSRKRSSMCGSTVPDSLRENCSRHEYSGPRQSDSFT